MTVKLKASYLSELLKLLTGTSASVPGLVRLRLFQNNATPATGAPVPGDFTECTISGYAAITLSAGTWSYSVSGGNGVATYPQQTFSLTGSGSLYGYFLTDSGNTVVHGYEFFTGAPITVPSGGLDVKITLDVELGPC